MSKESYTICFLGQTGFGKSSLINELFGTHFNTDPLKSCTKELYSVTTLSDDKLVTVYDTPGIGEFSNNSKYQEYYNYAVSKSDHIVLVVSLDRTDSTSQDLLESLKEYVINRSVQFTIVINRIDSLGVGTSGYTSWNTENNTPTEDCIKRVKQRIKNIHDNFDDVFLPFDVFPVCALRHYGIEDLRNRLIKK